MIPLLPDGWTLKVERVGVTLYAWVNGPNGEERHWMHILWRGKEAQAESALETFIQSTMKEFGFKSPKSKPKILGDEWSVPLEPTSGDFEVSGSEEDLTSPSPSVSVSVSYGDDDFSWTASVSPSQSPSPSASLSPSASPSLSNEEPWTMVQAAVKGADVGLTVAGPIGVPTGGVIGAIWGALKGKKKKVDTAVTIGVAGYSSADLPFLRCSQCGKSPLTCQCPGSPSYKPVPGYKPAMPEVDEEPVLAPDRKIELE